MIMILDIAVAAAIIFFLLNFFTKLIAEKFVKKPLPKWYKSALWVVSAVLGILSFMNNH